MTPHPRRNLAALRRACIALAATVACFIPAHSRGMGTTVSTLNDLAGLSPAQLEGLYARSGPGAIPRGKVRGLALLRSGTRLGPAISRGARVAWQGKVFDADGMSSVNRFFGVKAVRANVSYGPSWRDGNPAIILDYSQTSKLYEPYRDELREVAPGLYLGLMFDRRTTPPGLKMYFAVQTL
ncbi:MAG: hypothetical protein JWN86_3527 [Planctomycetota bacterium]|nr:hypothetical protein [Planctomycetota bacterium]